MSHRSRDHKHRGAGGAKASGSTYTGRSSWPTLEWKLQTKLDAQGLPGYITSGDITRPPPLAREQAGITQPPPPAREQASVTQHQSPPPARSTEQTGATSLEDEESKQQVTPALTSDDLVERLSALNTSLSTAREEGADETAITKQLQAFAASILQESSPQPALDGTTTITQTPPTQTGESTLIAAGSRKAIKLKYLKQMVEEYGPDEYNAANPVVQHQLFRLANKTVYEAVKTALGYKYRALINKVPKNDGLAAWDKVKKHHNNKTSATMTSYHKEYMNMSCDTDQRVRTFAEYVQALEDVASNYNQASGAKDLHIDDATKRSKLLELPPRYNKIVELIEDLEQERVLRDEEPYTCDQIEHKILTWEDTTKHRKFLDKKVAEEIKRRKKAKRLNHESRANVANSKQKQQGRRDRSNDTCNACGQKGHWANDPECPLNNKGHHHKHKHNGDTPPPGPCPICQDEHTKSSDWHWKSKCPKNKPRKPRAARAKARAARAVESDTDSYSDTDDEDMSWKQQYKLTKKMYRREKQGKRVPKLKAAAAWKKLTKHGKRSGRTHMVRQAKSRHGYHHRHRRHVRTPPSPPSSDTDSGFSSDDESDVESTLDNEPPASRSRSLKTRAGFVIGAGKGARYTSKVTVASSSIGQPSEFCIDSGASWTYASDDFNYEGEIRAVDHTVTTAGNQKLHCIVEGDIGPMKNVPALEGATFGLLSTGEVADQFGLATIFDSSHAYVVPIEHIKGLDPILIGHREDEGGLYMTDATTITAVLEEHMQRPAHACLCGNHHACDSGSEGGTHTALPASHRKDGQAHVYHDNQPADKIQLWHQRLGHMAIDKMITLAKQGVDSGLKITVDQLKQRAKDGFWCPVCAMGKITRFSHPKISSHKRATNILAVVHTDTHFPVHKKPSFRGYTCLQTYVDEATRMFFVGFLKTKDELPVQMTEMERHMALEARQSVQAPPPGQRGLRVQKYRTDNAGEESTGAKARERMMRKLIANDRSIPGESNQLAVAERANRTLLDMARVLLVDSKLPRKMWCYAYQHACFIINRTPNRSNKGNKTPYEMWYGKPPPKLSRLRTFGADCIVHLKVKERPNKSKLDPAGLPGKFIGYPSFKQNGYNSKGYLVWIPSKGAVYSRYSVHFQEDMLRVRGPLMGSGSNTTPTDTRSEDEDMDENSSQSQSDNDGELDMHEPAAPPELEPELSQSSAEEQLEAHTGDYSDGVQHEYTNTNKPFTRSHKQSGQQSSGSTLPEPGGKDGDSYDELDQLDTQVKQDSITWDSRPESERDITQGMMLRKHFHGHGTFTGQVIDIDQDKEQRRIYKVRYSDGDEEDLHASEIRHLVDREASDSNFVDMPNAPWSSDGDYADANDGWSQKYTTTGRSEKVRDIAKQQGVDLADLIAHNITKGRKLKGSDKLKRGTELWLPDDPGFSSDSSDSTEDEMAPLKASKAEASETVQEQPEINDSAACLAACLDLGSRNTDKLLRQAHGFARRAAKAAYLASHNRGKRGHATKATCSKYKELGKSRFLQAHLASRVALVEGLKHLKARDVPTPKKYSDAIEGDFKEFWKASIHKEIANLEDHNTWEWTDLPKGRKPIDATWAFRVKPNDDGLIEKFKSRLCARGFKEIYGIDYIESTAPVTTLTAFRTCIADAAQHGYKISIFDIGSAYLHAPLLEEIYMQPFPGISPPKKGQVMRLLKAIYGLKQSGRSWWKEMKGILIEELDFKVADADTCLFTIKLKSGHFIRLNVYVDDVCATYNNTSAFKTFMSALEGHLRKDSQSHRPVLSSSDDDNVYLGMTIDHLPDGAIKLHQARYTEDILAHFDHLDCKPASTPYISGYTPSKEDSPTTAVEIEDMRIVPYRSLIGKLMHLARCTRPDIAAAVGICAKYQSKPGRKHWKAAQQILRYLSGTRDCGIIYGRKTTEIPHGPCVGYVDADWGGDLDRRRSRTGFIYYSWGGPVSWSSIMQDSSALSSCEAEYMAACEATKEAIWLRRLFKDLGYNDVSIKTSGTLTEKEYEGHLPLTIFEDNKGTICLSKNPVLHKRTKHIEIRYHFVRDRVLDGSVKLEYCPSEKNIADLLTKAINRKQFLALRDKIISAG